MRIVIIGGGEVGSYIVALLLSNGHEVSLIEHDEKTFHMLEKVFPPEILFYGDGSDPDAMEKANIVSANVVAAVTGNDETNLVISTLAKMEFGIPRVVARVNNPKNAWLFDSGMGVDIRVNQADIMAHFIVEEMNIKDMFTLLKLTEGDYSIIKMKVGRKAKAADQLLKDLSLPKQTVLISITHDEVLSIPNGDTKILVGDDILLLADEASRKELNEIFD
ncbi:TrkA family potassium uptake protein [Acetobacterium paludosum]|uniref:Trk system potassium uptake protein TrkA n=1 Tax=Acetobacterium paludosum TaxID=52693 RepID=A0A923HXI5_9FIRM|nr:TrkA family potassium uptake protein [Acetobacterium paludosum]MBC3888957.1 TrkA family potassium uptake protein [Acetobacterium paludosum]